MNDEGRPADSVDCAGAIEDDGGSVDDDAEDDDEELEAAAE
jgi:hypothetical protein